MKEKKELITRSSYKIKKKDFIPISYDLPFKRIFGCKKNIDFATNMLETLFKLSKDSLNGSTITNSVVLDRRTINDRKFELDIVIKSPNEKVFIIEMQKFYDPNAEIKNLMYIFGLQSNSLQPGEKYSNINPTALINFVKNSSMHKGNKLIKRYFITEEDDPKDRILEDLFTILIIDVDSDRDINYNGDMSEFESWRRLIGAETYEEAKEVADKSNNPLIKEALKEAVKFMDNDYVQDYSSHEKLLRNQLEDVKIEAETKGRAEGERTKQLEIAKMLLKNNVQLEIISTSTGLSIEELEKIKEETN